MDRNQHITEAYKVIQHTIRTGMGPCGGLVTYIEGKLKTDREDLIQEVAADYCQYYKDDYDPEKSKINTFVNKFIQWRLMYYIRKHKADKRKMLTETTSWEELGEKYGNEIRHNFLSKDTNDNYYWNLYAKLLDGDTKNVL